jgi:hypothetical protein
MFERPSSSRSFPAKFPGICESCGEGFEVGEEVMFEGDDLVHANPDACLRFRDRPIQKPCSKCFLVHVGDCF